MIEHWCRFTGKGIKPPKGAVFKRHGAERLGKGIPRGYQVWIKEMNESEPTDDASRRQNMLSKPGNVEFPGMSIAEILFTGYTATVVEGA